MTAATAVAIKELISQPQDHLWSNSLSSHWSRVWMLASDWLRLVTWPQYWPLIGQLTHFQHLIGQWVITVKRKARADNFLQHLDHFEFPQQPLSITRRMMGEWGITVKHVKSGRQQEELAFSALSKIWICQFTVLKAFFASFNPIYWVNWRSIDA